MEISQQLRLEPALGQLVWHSWSEVQWGTHIVPPLPVVLVPDAPLEPEPVLGSVPVLVPVPVEVGMPAPFDAALAPPMPPPPTLAWVSLPDAHDATAAGANRAKTTKVRLACFTGL